MSAKADNASYASRAQTKIDEQHASEIPCFSGIPPTDFRYCHIDVWLKKIENLFISERIEDDKCKIDEAKSFIVFHSPCGRLVRRDPKLRNATNWNEFKSILRSFYSFRDRPHPLQTFEPAFNMTWKPDQDFTDFYYLIYGRVETFIKAVNSQSPPFMQMEDYVISHITNAFVYHQIPKPLKEAFGRAWSSTDTPDITISKFLLHDPSVRMNRKNKNVYVNTGKSTPSSNNRFYKDTTSYNQNTQQYKNQNKDSLFPHSKQPINKIFTATNYAMRQQQDNCAKQMSNPRQHRKKQNSSLPKYCENCRTFFTHCTTDCWKRLYCQICNESHLAGTDKSCKGLRWDVKRAWEEIKYKKRNLAQHELDEYESEINDESDQNNEIYEEFVEGAVGGISARQSQLKEEEEIEIEGNDLNIPNTQQFKKENKDDKLFPQSEQPKNKQDNCSKEKSDLKQTKENSSLPKYCENCRTFFIHCTAECKNPIFCQICEEYHLVGTNKLCKEFRWDVKGAWEKMSKKNTVKNEIKEHKEIKEKEYDGNNQDYIKSVEGAVSGINATPNQLAKHKKETSIEEREDKPNEKQSKVKRNVKDSEDNSSEMFMKLHEETRSYNIELKVCGISTLGFVVTGAQMSLIKESFLKKLNDAGNHIPVYKQNLYMKDACGTPLQAYGFIHMDFKIEQFEYRAKFIVVPDSWNFSTDIFMGSDVFSILGARINLSQGCIMIKGTIIKLVIIRSKFNGVINAPALFWA